MQAVIDSLLVNYTDVGKGPVVLMLHGWGSSGPLFKPLSSELTKYFRVVIPDLPGLGNSERPKEPWDLARYAEFVGEFLKKAKVKPSVIVAHSNGAAIAIKGLASKEFETDKLVIIGGAGIRPKQTSRKLVLNIVAKTGKAATLVLPKGKRKKIRDAYYKKIGSDYRLLEGMEETFNKVVGEDVLQLSKQISVPTLLIYGENDESTPVTYGHLYHEAFPNSTLEIVGGAGHYVFADKPDKVSALVKDFLK